MPIMQGLCVTQYRGIRNLKIHNLKQVNLIVGDNNCGKTSVLEAIQLLRSSGSLANVYRVARQRDALAMTNSNSIFDSFMCMFPHDKNGKQEIGIIGKYDDSDVTFSLCGRKNRVLLDPKELDAGKYKVSDIPEGEIEADCFSGAIILNDGNKEKKTPIDINQYSIVTGTSSSEKDRINIVYVPPYEHLRGNIISKILRDEAYKQICVKALQLFDSDIEDLMLFRSDVGNRPVEYIRHRQLGDMPVSTYGDGLKKVLVISNAIAQAAGGILLFDEVETSIHRKYYDDIFRFLVKACKSFRVQVFVTTHSIEAIDGILVTQDYESQTETDDICVCTLNRTTEETYSRVLTGREVFENREAFGFEVRL